MNNFLKQVIEEKFASKAQQRFFYAKANEKGASKKEKKKWSKWANEFSDETNFKKLPEKTEKEVDEIVDASGNIKRGEFPTDLPKKGITSKLTTDKAAKQGAGSMGTHGVHGTHTSLRYWAETDMSKVLGFDDTMGKDLSYEDAVKVLKSKGIVDPIELKQRLEDMGYVPDNKGDEVLMVENPKGFMKGYLETVMSKKTNVDDVISKEPIEIPRILQRQIESLSKSLKNSGLTIDDVKKFLEKTDEQ